MSNLNQLIGFTEEKYINEYLNEYKKETTQIPGGSKSSNISPRFDAVSNDKDKKIQPQEIEIDKDVDIDFEYLKENSKKIVEEPLDEKQIVAKNKAIEMEKIWDKRF